LLKQIVRFAKSNRMPTDEQPPMGDLRSDAILPGSAEPGPLSGLLVKVSSLASQSWGPQDCNPPQSPRRATMALGPLGSIPTHQPQTFDSRMQCLEFLESLIYERLQEVQVQVWRWFVHTWYILVHARMRMGHGVSFSSRVTACQCMVFRS
jgi:hypothetical protein